MKLLGLFVVGIVALFAVLFMLFSIGVFDDGISGRATGVCPSFSVDSDSGFFVKGSSVVSGCAASNVSDFCVNPCVVGEYVDSALVYFNCSFGCVDGACLETDSVPPLVEYCLSKLGGNETDSSYNLKNKTMYSYNPVFLISDYNWKDTLSLVPLAVWTENDQIHSHPVLIYHVEETGYDAESIIYFIRQYGSNNITMVDNENLWNSDLEAKLMISEPTSEVKHINPQDYFSFWTQYSTVVYVEDNYSLSLLASTYASAINAPLIIEGSSPDSPEYYTGKKIVCVGNIISSIPCSEEYSSETLMKKYIRVTDTNKLLIVNTHDLITSIDEEFQGTSGIIRNLYTKESLSSPILASARHELIVSVDIPDSFLQPAIEEGYSCSRTVFLNYEKNVYAIKEFLQDTDSRFPGRFDYLTIISAPQHIPASFNRVFEDNGGCIFEWGWGNSADNLYADDVNELLELEYDDFLLDGKDGYMYKLGHFYRDLVLTKIDSAGHKVIENKIIEHRWWGAPVERMDWVIDSKSQIHIFYFTRDVPDQSEVYLDLLSAHNNYLGNFLVCVF